MNPSNSAWLMERIMSLSSGVSLGCSEMKSTSKLLKSLFDLCGRGWRRERGRRERGGREEGESEGGGREESE